MIRKKKTRLIQPSEPVQTQTKPKELSPIVFELVTLYYSYWLAVYPVFPKGNSQGYGLLSSRLKSNRKEIKFLNNSTACNNQAVRK